MGNYINLIEEVKDRLEAAIAEGEVLEDVFRVRIGSKESARGLNDYPIININVKTGDEEAVSMQRRFSCELALEITLITNKLDSDSNVLYNTATESGSLYLLEKLLNVLDDNISGSVDVGFSNTTHELRIVDWVLEEEKFIEITITVTVKTLAFYAGAR